MPAIDTFTLDELETLYRYCGLTISDWGRRFTPEGADVWDKGTEHPGFQKALVHVAYERGNTQETDDAVRELVGGLVWLDVVEPLLEAEPEPDPLAETSPDETPSDSSPSGSEPSTKRESQPSGTSSSTGSETDTSQPAPTGTGRSETSPTSPPLRQVI